MRRVPNNATLYLSGAGGAALNVTAGAATASCALPAARGEVSCGALPAGDLTLELVAGGAGLLDKVVVR